jgi:myo-inositol-1(or 4)-monophosphatase
MINSTDLNDLILVSKNAALLAGICLSEKFSHNVGIISDSGKDIKTEADKSSELIIIENLQSTGLKILSEECGVKLCSNKICDTESPADELMWVIDPLDGTYNYSRSFAFCCVSIGLMKGNEPVMGVIYDFPNELMYTGACGIGAFCNGSAISVSDVENFEQASLATGYPSKRNFSDEALARSIKQIQQFKKIRMLGSAAISLASVAEGKIDAYSEDDIWLWDVAAGLAILKAAGGDFKISKINENYQLNVSANNGLLNHL